LLGKTVKDVQNVNQLNKDGKKGDTREPIIPIIRDTYATPENEAFTKMMEDPLVYIKMKEQESRN
jgi:hypothetical protein